jgi:hypothetical protein
MPNEKTNPDLAKLFAYGTLAQFWTNAAREEMFEEDAKALLLLQQALIEEYEQTLKSHLDEEQLKRFKDFVERFKIRMVFKEGAKASKYRGK